MKKIFLSFLVLTTICLSQIHFSNAISTLTYITQTFDDGSYIEETISEVSSITKTTTTKTKTLTYKSETGVARWSLSVTGTFSYNGSIATCTNSKVSTKNYSTTWRLSNAKASKNGNQAIASITAKQYTSNGTLSRTINKSVKLTCSPNGVIS